MGAPAEGAEWERLFRLVFERSSNPIVLLDERRQILEINDAAHRLLGRNAHSVIGTSIAERILPAERRESEREWEEFLRTGEYAGTRSLLRADGSRVEVDFAAQLAMLDGRKVAVYVAVPLQGAALSPGSRQAGEPALTTREREIVTLISLGADTAEMARMLHISPETVRTHVRNAMAKLGARTRAQLVAIVLCDEQNIHPGCLEPSP